MVIIDNSIRKYTAYDWLSIAFTLGIDWIKLWRSLDVVKVKLGYTRWMVAGMRLLCVS